MRHEDAVESSARADAAGRKPFGSTLNVSGYALAEAAGLVPLAPVMGCDARSLATRLPLPVYRQTPHLASPVPDQQYADDVVAVEDLDREVTEARHRAYAHVREQAARLGADAVIELQQSQGSLVPTARRRDLGRVAAAVRQGPRPYLVRTLEYQLTGTAVRDQASRSSQPRLSGVSASEFWRLRRGGWEPVDVVGGCAHRFGASLWFGSAGHEIQGSTAIWTTAREAAFAQLEGELKQLAADGVIGITMEAAHQMFDWTERVEMLGQTGRLRRSRIGRQGMLVSVSLRGTAVRRVRRPADVGMAVTRTLQLS